MKTKELRGEEGQAAVFITILLMFALIALTALAIDGGHLYVVRRDLQNMSDAACLAAATELSLLGTEGDPYNAAVEYILANGGSEELYTPHTPPGEEGVGLVKGIQVSGADVRVALQQFVDTYFTMIFNRSGALVGARSHCGSIQAGGLLPIAVRRYEYDEDDPTLQLDLLANKECQPETGCYYYNTDTTHGAATWPDYVYRYGPMPVYLPNSEFTPISGTLTYSLTGNIDCDVPPRDDPPDYVGLCILGDGVATNDGTADYKGFVLLDARNIVPGPVEYLNDATGQADTNKYISKRYFHEGYGGPNPMVGDQLAMLDGVSNDFAAQEMAQWWHEGDVFWAVVYSGYVWDVPDLEMSIEPPVQHISPTISMTGTIATVPYTVTLEKTGPSPWEGDANFALDASFMEALGEITPTVDIPSTVILPQWQPSVQVPMTVSVFITDTNLLKEYLSALTVGAREIGLGLRRWASTNFQYGDVDGDFTLYAHALEYNVPQDGSLDIPLTTLGFGCADGKASLAAAPVGGYDWGTVFTSGQSGKIKVLDGKDNSSTFTLKVRDNAILGWYTVRLTADPACAPAHSVEIAVNVYPPTPGGEPKRFVIVEGFAPFRVSYKDANTIGAYAIGPIIPCLEQNCYGEDGEGPDVVQGLNPRLLPW